MNLPDTYDQIERLFIINADIATFKQTLKNFEQEGISRQMIAKVVRQIRKSRRLSNHKYWFENDAIWIEFNNEGSKQGCQ